MKLRQLSGIAEVSAERWDALFDPGYPFTRHAFLRALEAQGCATPARGWTPCHLLLEDADGALIAAAPLYLKSHSWGEFVFDQGWARGAQSAGIAYYPKLLTACPFTPASGPRIGARDETARRALIQALLALPEAMGASSWHGLFFEARDAQAAESEGALLRNDVQFHWHNAARPYTSFDNFLATLKREKRKNIVQERRRLMVTGLKFEICPGETYREAEWAALYALYANTYEERGQPPYLTLEFFLDWARAPGSPARVIVARMDGKPVAMAFCVQGADTLYGRHWGTAQRIDGLHFEACYYQGIEHCIAEGLARYDAGAQGEHKLARGFDPVMTTSVHQLAHPGLHAAVARALTRERPPLAASFAQLQAHSAYKPRAP